MDSKKRRFIEETLDIELSEYEAKYNAFEKIDAYVDYDLHIAIESLKCGRYPVTIFFCAIALEEQLSAIYEIKTEGDRNKLFKRMHNGKLTETELSGMNLDRLIKWAVDEGIIKDESDALNAIRYARNFFGHATRIMIEKTIKNFDNGVFEKNLPPGIEFPDWLNEMQKFHEIKTGEKIDSSKPVIGWLDSKETAVNVYKTTIDFIEATSKILY